MLSTGQARRHDENLTRGRGDGVTRGITKHFKFRIANFKLKKRAEELVNFGCGRREDTEDVKEKFDTVIEGYNLLSGKIANISFP